MPRQFHYQAVFDGSVWHEADEPFRDVTFGVSAWDEVTYVELMACRCGSKQQGLACHSDGRHLFFANVCCASCQLFNSSYGGSEGEAWAMWNDFQVREKANDERARLSKRDRTNLDREQTKSPASTPKTKHNAQLGLWD